MDYIATPTSTLEETLARVDLKQQQQHDQQSLTDTASLTATDNASLVTLELKPTPSKSELASLDVDEQVILRAVTTPILGFDSLTDSVPKFVPMLEARGGTDKDESGHRRDSVPIAQEIGKLADCASAIFHFLEEVDEASARSNAILRRHLLRSAKGVVVRVNPGTLTPASQARLEMMLVELSSAGLVVMSTPDVQRLLGAKDALVKIRHLECGMEDTSVYYDAESFRQGFRQSIAYRPRVIKQNRGSQGEGIWIVHLKDESQYCSYYGEKMASLDTELVLTEANDNHVEYHTVGEFLEFAVNGRTEEAGEWSSQGRGCYLEGGVDAGAMLVDQRFLPRIVEGEVRCNMIGSELVSIVHKVPKEGGVSATLQSGAVYTSYAPDEPKFKRMVDGFLKDLPKMMLCFGLESQPLPLLWTADFIFGEPDAEGQDTFALGEFNCSCVGITKELFLAPKVAEVAVAALEQ